jgi:hypothetical protein
MILYYTCIQGTAISQPKPEFSLGGYMSSSPVPNGILGNLFSELSLLTLDKLQDEFIGLILYNEQTTPSNDVELYFNYPTPDLNGNPTNICKYYIASVQLNMTGQPMENILNRNAQPFNATFYDAAGQSEAVNLGVIPSQTGLALWIKRSVISDNIKLLFDPTTLDNNFLAGTVPSSVEEIDMVITY